MASPKGSNRRVVTYSTSRCAPTAALRIVEPLCQFLVAFRDFMHHPLSLRITEGFGQGQRLFSAISHFASQK